MKKFLAKVFIFFVLIHIVAILGFILPNPAAKENLHHSRKDKHRLLEQTGSPRIILAGGSNVSFGIYSKLIEEKFEVPVINTAIHAGYGLKFIIDDLLHFIQKNDIVILIPEYSQFTGDTFYGGEALVQAFEANINSLEHISIHQAYQILPFFYKISYSKIESYPGELFGGRNEAADIGPYERKSFNAYGDVVAHWELPSSIIRSTPLKGEIYSDAFEYVSQFERIVNQKGAQLFLSYPCWNETSFKLNEKIVIQIKNELESRNFKILGTPEEFSFNESLYFNSTYHLTKRGQLIRTERLIKEIENNDFHGYHHP